MGSPKTKVQRFPERAACHWPSEKEWGGSAPSGSWGTDVTTVKEACRAQSPFSWALLTPLSETVLCQ